MVGRAAACSWCRRIDRATGTERGETIAWRRLAVSFGGRRSTRLSIMQAAVGILAVGALGPPTGSDLFWCEATFAVPDVPSGRAFHSVRLGDRPDAVYSGSALAASNCQVRIVVDPRAK
jgi:hypothetical protein